MSGMHWHAQVTSLKLRGYSAAGGYASRRPFDGVMDVMMMGDGRAFAHGALVKSGRLSRADMTRIGEILVSHGVRELLAERNGRLVCWWSASAPSAPAGSGPATGEVHSHPVA